jgi:hypothetical protein
MHKAENRSHCRQLRNSTIQRSAADRMRPRRFHLFAASCLRKAPTARDRKWLAGDGRCGSICSRGMRPSAGILNGSSKLAAKPALRRFDRIFVVAFQALKGAPAITRLDHVHQAPAVRTSWYCLAHPGILRPRAWAVINLGHFSKGFGPRGYHRRRSPFSTRLRLLPTFLTAFFTAGRDRPVFFAS